MNITSITLEEYTHRHPILKLDRLKYSVSASIDGCLLCGINVIDTINGVAFVSSLKLV